MLEQDALAAGFWRSDWSAEQAAAAGRIGGWIEGAVGHVHVSLNGRGQRYKRFKYEAATGGKSDECVATLQRAPAARIRESQ